MMRCFNPSRPVSTTGSIDKAAGGGAAEITAPEDAIPKIMNTAPELVKALLQLGKGVITSIDPLQVSKLALDISKAAGGVPIVGLGISALAIIINNVAMAQGNKEKRQEIQTHARFLQEHLPELGDDDDNNPWHGTLKKHIVILCREACILEYESKKRGGFRTWLGNAAFARCNATTLQHVAEQLHQIQENFNTLLIARVIHLTPQRLRGSQGDPSFELIGIEARKKDVMRFLINIKHAEICAVGIYGMGGIGKTTLLKALQREIRGKKTHAVAYVEVKQEPSIKELQQDIVEQLSERREIYIDIEEGRERLQKCLSDIKDNKKKKVCIILDNVWSDEHLKDLFPEKMKEHLLPSSYLIMSTRQKHQAECFCDSFGTSKENCFLYEPLALNDKEAKHLFEEKATRGGQALTKADNELVNKIVPLCGGLPLALEVYGSHFSNKKNREREHWTRVEKKLKEAADSVGEERVFKRLDTSLEFHTEAFKLAFVDAALFWRGKDWEDAKVALAENQDAGDEYLVQLEGQSLLAKDEEESNKVKVKVHDLMVALAHKRAKHFQASYMVNEVPDHSDQKSLDEVRGWACFDAVVNGADLSKMNSLQFLHLDECCLQVNLGTGKLFPKTKHGWWLFLFLLLILSLTISMPIMLAQVFSKPIFLLLLVVPLILVLVYVFSLHVSPPMFLPTTLTFLTVKNCVDTSSLEDSIANLSNLRILNLSQNHGIFQFSKSFFTRLTSLRNLDLSSCEDLTKLPYFFGSLKSLEVLDLSSCPQLRHLPKSIGELSKLKTLNVSECHLLAEFPDSLGSLTSLKTLRASNCDALRNLPSSFGRLASLEYLDLSCSDKLIRLPPTVSNLPCLQTINMSHCSGLRELPETLGNLSSLKTLSLSHCVRRAKLPPSIGKLVSLHTLDLSSCQQLRELPSTLDKLATSLQIVDLKDCRNLQNVPAWLRALKPRSDHHQRSSSHEDNEPSNPI